MVSALNFKHLLQFGSISTSCMKKTKKKAIWGIWRVLQGNPPEKMFITRYEYFGHQIAGWWWEESKDELHVLIFLLSYHRLHSTAFTPPRSPCFKQINFKTKSNSPPLFIMLLKLTGALFHYPIFNAAHPIDSISIKTLNRSIIVLPKSDGRDWIFLFS